MYKEELLILKENLENRNKEKIYIIAKQISDLIEAANFAQILYDDLLKIFDSKSFCKQDRIKIKEITEEIIIELVTSGTDIKNIQDYVPNIFSSYIELEHNRIIFNFNHAPEELDDIGKKAFIDSLSIKHRLNIFRENLKPKTMKFTFIYPIWGLSIPYKINPSDNCILEFNIYNPEFYKVFHGEDELDEIFKDQQYNQHGDIEDQDKPLLDYTRCNATITLYAYTYNTAKKLAEEKFTNLLNLLNLKFTNNSYELFWDGQFISKNHDFNNGSYSSQLNDDDKRITLREWSKKRPINLSDNKINLLLNVSEIIKDLEELDMFYEANTLINVINILAKAKWISDENRLLNYWIAIESLANISKQPQQTTFDFIKDCISNMYFIWEQFAPTHNLFRITDMYSMNTNSQDDTVSIPGEFLENVGIYKSREEDSEVSLVNFFNRISELKQYTTKIKYLDEIEDTILFYADNKVSLNQLKQTREKVKITIDYIYKCRNQIVHNGYIDKNLIPFLVNYAKVYAESLFDRILETYKNHNFNIQSHFISELYEGNLLERKLSSNEFFDIGLAKK